MRLYDYAASGNCYKVRLLLALLGTPCERIPIDIFAGDTLTLEYARVNPVRETPVLELDTGETIAQSGAILWYLAEGTSFLPTSRLERAQVLQWLSFEQERIMLGVGSTRFRRMTGRAELDPDGRCGTFRRRHESARAARRPPRRPPLRQSESAARSRICRCSAYTHVAGDAGFELVTVPGRRRVARARPRRCRAT